MDSEQDKSEEIAKIKRKIAGVKNALKTAPDPEQRADRGNRRGLTGKSPGSVACRWKPGETGNPNSAGKPKKARFWRYVVRLLDMTRDEVDGIDESGMTLAQLGAKSFCLKVAEGKWAMVKEVIDRELGRIREMEEEDESGAPLMVKLPFKMLKNA